MSSQSFYSNQRSESERKKYFRSRKTDFIITIICQKLEWVESIYRKGIPNLDEILESDI